MNGALLRVIIGCFVGLTFAATWIFLPPGFEIRGLSVVGLLLVFGLVLAIVRDPWRRGLVVGLAAFFPMALYGIDFSKLVAWFSFVIVPALFLLSPTVRGSGTMWPGMLLLFAGAILTRLTFLLRGLPQPNWQGDMLFLSTLCLVPFLTHAVRQGWIRIHSLAVALGTSGVILSVFSIGLAAVTGRLFVERLGLSGGINPNIVCSFLDFSLPLTMMLYFLSDRLRVRIPVLAAVALQLAVMVLAQTRGSVPGYVLTGLTFVYLIRRQTLFLASILMTAAPFIALVGMKVVQRILRPDTNDSASNLGRLGLLQVAFEVLRQNSFVLGVGMDNFKKIKESFGFPRWFDQTMMMSSHNAHLEFWLGWGFPGLVGWLLLLGGAIWRCLVVYKRRRHPLALGLALALIGFSLHGLVESLVAAPPFLVVLSLVIGMAYGIDPHEAHPDDQLRASTTRNS